MDWSRLWILMPYAMEQDLCFLKVSTTLLKDFKISIGLNVVTAVKRRQCSAWEWVCCILPSCNSVLTATITILWNLILKICKKEWVDLLASTPNNSSSLSTICWSWMPTVDHQFWSCRMSLTNFGRNREKHKKIKKNKGNQLSPLWILRNSKSIWTKLLSRQTYTW